MRHAAALVLLFAASPAWSYPGWGRTPAVDTAVPWVGVAVMAGAAALGYWILHMAQRDRGKVRRAGQAAGWCLLVVGLLGFTAGSVAQGLRAFAPSVHARLTGGACPYMKGQGSKPAVLPRTF